METVWGFNNEIQLSSVEDSFIPLNQEQVNRLIEIWSEEKIFALNKEISIYGDYHKGFITLEEKRILLEKILDDAFLITQQRFIEEFGVCPIKGIVD